MALKREAVLAALQGDRWMTTGAVAKEAGCDASWAAVVLQRAARIGLIETDHLGCWRRAKEHR